MTENKPNHKDKPPVLQLSPEVLARIDERLKELPMLPEFADYKPDFISWDTLDRDRITGKARAVCRVVARVPGVVIDGGVMLPEAGKPYEIAIETRTLKKLLKRVYSDEHKELMKEAVRAFWRKLAADVRQDLANVQPALAESMTGERVRSIVEDDLPGETEAERWAFDIVRTKHVTTGDSVQAQFHELSEGAQVGDLESVVILGTTEPRWNKQLSAQRMQQQAEGGGSGGGNEQLLQIIAQQQNQMAEMLTEIRSMRTNGKGSK